MMRVGRCGCLMVWLFGLACAPSQAAQRKAVLPLPSPTAQVLADATLIDDECRDTRVIFGEAFRFGERHGEQIGSFMPGGVRRADFDAAYRKRFAETPHDELCKAVVRHYQALIPGLFVTP